MPFLLGMSFLLAAILTTLVGEPVIGCFFLLAIIAYDKIKVD